MADARNAHLKEKITEAILHPKARNSLYECMERSTA